MQDIKQVHLFSKATVGIFMRTTNYSAKLQNSANSIILDLNNVEKQEMKDSTLIAKLSIGAPLKHLDIITLGTEH